MQTVDNLTDKCHGKTIPDYHCLTREAIIELLEQRDAELKDKDAELARQSHRILELERMVYGRRSEKRLPESASDWTGTLFDEQWAKEGSPVQVETLPLIKEIREQARQRRASRRASRPSRKGTAYASYVPENIEREVTEIYPEGYDPERMVIIGHDKSEHLCLRASSFYVRVEDRLVCRLKEAKPTDASVSILEAPLRKQAADCFADASLLAEIVIAKFAYHQPEYRQCARWKEQGVNIPTSTVNRWVHGVADALYPLYRLQARLILQSPYLQVDETSVQVSDRKGKTRKGYLWGVRDALRSRGVFFHWKDGSRSGSVPDELFRGYHGAIQSDGYEAYSRFENVEGIVLLGCMAHVRRKFEHLAADDRNAAHIVETIATLYELEENLRYRKAPPEEVEAERKAKAYPILKYLETYMRDVHRQYTPGEAMEKALRYAFAVWIRIGRYVQDGRFNIDNNLMEQAIRPVTLGRKNYLFCGNNEGAENNAVFYTFMACCREAGLQPYKWLKEVLSKPLPDMTEDELVNLLPMNFK
jgi:transposase